MREIETQRLRLREVSTKDFEFLARLMTQDGYLHNVGDRGVRNAADAATYFSTAPIYDYSKGLGFNIVETRSGERVGICGLVHRLEQNLVEIGYGFLDRVSGQGLATEVATATVAHAFGNLELAELYGVTNSANLASRRVLEKLGMKLTRVDECEKCFYVLKNNHFRTTG